MLEKIKNLFKKETEEAPVTNSFEEQFDELFNSLGGNIITFEFGEDFVEYKDSILETIGKYRETLREKNGFIIPPVHILSNDKLQENEIIIKIREKQVLENFIIPNEKHLKKEVEKSLELVCENYIDDIFTCELTEKYINAAQNNLLGTVWNITALYSVVEIKEVLLKLLKSKKSIKNISYVFEKFAEHALSSGFCEHHSAEKLAKKIGANL